MFKFRNGRFVYLAPEHKDNGGTPETKPQEDQPSATPAEAKNTDTGAGEHMIPKSRFDELNNKLKAMEEAQAKLQQEREEAERKAAEEQGEYRKLYEQATAKLGELTPKSQMADKLAEMVSAQLKAEVDKWPEEVKALLPTEPTDTLALYEAVNRARPLAAKLTEVDNKVPAGNGRGPKPSGPKVNKTPIAPVVDVRRTF